jgi:hypothetical protein
VKSVITPNASGETIAAKPAAVLMNPLATHAKAGATSIGTVQMGPSVET